MHAHVQKWGNSLALRIPKSLADQARIVQGTLVEITVEGHVLQIETVAPEEYTLESLLGAVTDENRHEEIGAGPSRGREAW